MGAKINERDLVNLKHSAYVLLEDISWQIASEVKKKFTPAIGIYIGQSSWPGRCSECGCMQFECSFNSAGGFKVVVNNCRECPSVHIVVPYGREYGNQFFKQLLGVHQWAAKLLESSQSELDALEVVEGKDSLDLWASQLSIKGLKVYFKPIVPRQRLLDLEA